MLEVLYVTDNKIKKSIDDDNIHYTFSDNISSALSHIINSKIDLIIIDNTSISFSGFLLAKQIPSKKNLSIWINVDHEDTVTIVGTSRLGIDRTFEKASVEVINELVRIYYNQKIQQGSLKLQEDYIICVDKLWINTKDMTAKCANGAWVKLQQKQFDILKYLMERPGECVTSEEIWKACWKESIDDSLRNSCLNTLHIHIHKLRMVLAQTSNNLDASKYIHTVTNKGYKFLEKNEQYKD